MLNKLLSLTLVLVGIAVVIFFFLPIAEVYFNHRPIFGVDFYNSVTFARFFRDNFEILPRAYSPFWYTGYPIFSIPIFVWYWIIGIIAKFLPLIEATKFSVIGGFAALFVFFYLAAYTLSRNQIFSALLAILVILSANMYGSAFWGGSLPYAITQLTLPLSLWLVAGYLASGNKRWFWACVFVSGISLLGHPAISYSFTVLGVTLLLLLGSRKESISFKSKIVQVIVFGSGVYFLGYRMTQGFLTMFLVSLPSWISGKILIGFEQSGTSGVLKESGQSVDLGAQAIADFYKTLFDRLFTDSNQWLFVVLALVVVLSFLAFIVDRNKRKVLSVVPWLLISFYSVLNVYLNSQGITFMAQGWYRAFWHFPITLGLSIAAFAGYSHMAFYRLHKTVGRGFYIFLTIVAVVGIGVVYQIDEVKKVINLVDVRSSPSSAHPEALNLVRDQKDLDNLKNKLLPSWINASEQNYRIFTSDAQVNVWWNALFDIPLARGYIDPPIGSGKAGNHFLLDQSIAGDGLVVNFKYPEDTAKQMALYYIDWYSVAYIEGAHLSKSANKGPSSYLKEFIEQEETVEAKGAYILYDTKSGKPEVWEDVPQYLNYYRFREDLVSPILSATNAPSVLCLCDWPAYESFTKILSMHNLNSRYVTTIFSPDNIDSLILEDLSHFDLIVLNNYKYSNSTNAFSLLNDYAENGGKIFIDTGGEVPESQAKELPEIFPFKSSERKGLGMNWDLSASQNPIFDDIDFSEFSPPIFNQNEWKLSYPAGWVKSGSEVLLRSHGKPLLISSRVGKGIVLWSGMNLSYHVHSYINIEESKLFVNLLGSLVSLEKKDYIKGKPEFLSSRSITFQSENSAKGVLFREEFFDGWNTQLNGKTVKAYRAGPAYPGFIYIPTKERSSPFKATISYQGSLGTYLLWIMNVSLMLIFADLIVFGGKLFSHRLFLLAKRLRKRVGGWWEKEEES